METKDVYLDAFGRVRELVHSISAGLDAETLAYRPDADANSIAWLLWHLTRAQDDHVSEIAGRDQVWVSGDWAERFGLPPDPANTGWGHTSAEVAMLQPSGPEVLSEYHDVVAAATTEYLQTINAEELDRIIDYSWDPPVSVGVRLVSVVDDSAQHAGQAAYVRGLAERLASNHGT